MSKQNEERPKVTLGGEEYEIPPLTARNGLGVAFMLVPHIVAVAPTIQKAMRQPPEEERGRWGGWGVEVIAEAIAKLQGLLGPDSLLDLGHLITGIETDRLAEAPIGEFVAAVVKGFVSVDVRPALEAVASMMASANVATLLEKIEAEGTPESGE